MYRFMLGIKSQIPAGEKRISTQIAACSVNPALRAAACDVRRRRAANCGRRNHARRQLKDSRVGVRRQNLNRRCVGTH